MSCLLLQVAAHFRPRQQELKPIAIQHQTAAVQQEIQNKRMAFAVWRESTALQKVLNTKLQSQLNKFERHRLRAAFGAWRHAAFDHANRRRWVRLVTVPVLRNVMLQVEFQAQIISFFAKPLAVIGWRGIEGP